MNQDFKEFFKSLNARGVEFLVVGGVAYNSYAPPRATKDIDVWIHPTVENATERGQDLVDAKKLRAIADRKRT